MEMEVGVIESLWHDDRNGIKRNTTVKPLFDFISDIHCENHHGYAYEMVGTQEAFASALERLAKSKATKIAYLAMHGSQDGLHLHSGHRISRTILKNTLLRITNEPKSKLTGLYFGSCLFGSKALAEYLFSHDTSVTWIAGYQESIDFVASSCLDMLFFNTMMDVRRDFPNYTDLKKIKEVARRIRVQMQGLCNSPLENEYSTEKLGLGFSIYINRRGRSPQVIDLLRE